VTTARLRLRIAALAAAALLALASPTAGAQDPEPRALALRPRPAGVESVRLAPVPGGAYAYEVRWRDGRLETLSPEAFSELLYTGHSGRKPLFAFLNITSPIGVAWVGLGLLGQVLFAGRMLVQWLASERRRQSVVPVAFWWLSLGGASLLIVYFIWRKDAVGVLGQATGWVIYVRNLHLIYRAR
jgi:lipid-A-disaccharide synthase-like uncharacterized protein